jgi:hypothetical protein
MSGYICESKAVGCPGKDTNCPAAGQVNLAWRGHCLSILSLPTVTMLVPAPGQHLAAVGQAEAVLGPSQHFPHLTTPLAQCNKVTCRQYCKSGSVFIIKLYRSGV